MKKSKMTLTEFRKILHESGVDNYEQMINLISLGLHRTADMIGGLDKAAAKLYRERALKLTEALWDAGWYQERFSDGGDTPEESVK